MMSCLELVTCFCVTFDLLPILVIFLLPFTKESVVIVHILTHTHTRVCICICISVTDTEYFP